MVQLTQQEYESMLYGTDDVDLQLDILFAVVGPRQQQDGPASMFCNGLITIVEEK